MAALFALHPLHVESVAWITERKDVLSTLFRAALAVGLLRYARSGRSLGRTRRVFNRFRREPALEADLVTLPFLLLLLDYWPLGRMQAL